MTPEEQTHAIDDLKAIEMWLRSHDDHREKINNAVFTVANAMKVHPRTLAYYILLRTLNI